MRGSCLCGEVSFEIDADLRDPIACHCMQCRQQSGHYFSAVAAPKTALRLTADAQLRWYRHTETARRGFCGICGSTLFWRDDDGAKVMVAMASLDAPTGLRLAGHYWTDFKGDYYQIADGLPQYAGEDT